jgi:hypothetical protein
MSTENNVSIENYLPTLEGSVVEGAHVPTPIVVVQWQNNVGIMIDYGKKKAQKSEIKKPVSTFDQFCNAMAIELCEQENDKPISDEDFNNPQIFLSDHRILIIRNINSLTTENAHEDYRRLREGRGNHEICGHKWN